MIEYDARITVELEDLYNMVKLPPVTLIVRISSDSDPRALLTRQALEEAVAIAQSTERFMS